MVTFLSSKSTKNIASFLAAMLTAACLWVVGPEGDAGATTRAPQQNGTGLVRPVISHVSCYGDYCSGQSPVSTGCSVGAVTIASVDLGWAALDLRWSPTCQTNWARIYVYPTKTLGPGFIVAQQSTGYAQYGNIYVIASFSAQTETEWTPMIYSPKLCVRVGANLGTGYSYDTDWTGCY